ncbi:MAG TPA: hypothetical protein VGM03_23165 [Phycisphaerae bacterium]|jgi:hypothetical protein
MFRKGIIAIPVLGALVALASWLTSVSPSPIAETAGSPTWRITAAPPGRPAVPIAFSDPLGNARERIDKLIASGRPGVKLTTGALTIYGYRASGPTESSARFAGFTVSSTPVQQISGYAYNLWQCVIPLWAVAVVLGAYPGVVMLRAFRAIRKDFRDQRSKGAGTEAPSPRSGLLRRIWRRRLLAATIAPAVALLAIGIVSYFVMIEHYHSTDRYCARIGVANGFLFLRYDGGLDMFGPWTKEFRMAGVVLSAVPGRWSPWQFVDAALPLWLPLVILSAPAAVLFIRRTRAMFQRRKYGLCVGCGYNLTGNTSGVCPECGVALR